MIDKAIILDGKVYRPAYKGPRDTSCGACDLREQCLAKEGFPCADRFLDNTD